MTTNEAQHHAAAEHGHGGHGHAEHGHEREHQGQGEHEHEHHEDWNSEEYVAGWLERQKERAPERRKQFVIIRSLIPRHKDEEFRYLNLGAGPGNLDEVLLEHFPKAQATLLDTSLMMLGHARQRLEKYEGRVEYVQANLKNPDWHHAVSGPFDYIVSTISLHHLDESDHIRDVYEDAYQLLGHGGMFINLEYVRPVRPSLLGLATWAAKDPEAGFSGNRPNHDLPGTLQEQLAWLNEAGFPCVEIPWKSMNTVVLCAIRDHLHVPAEEHEHGEHGHGEHGHGGGH